MIALLTLALVQTAPPPAESDIVVTSLRRLRIATQVEHGRVHACQIRVTSGDADIDRTACEATVTCFNTGATDPERLADCVETHVAAFVRKRSAG